MFKVHLFQYKSQFNTVFNVNPGDQCSPIFLVSFDVNVKTVPAEFQTEMTDVHCDTELRNAF
jgi:hypothetical protein